MATGSYWAGTPGSGFKIATGPTYTENSNVVQDQKVIQGLQYLPTYRIVSAAGVPLTTANSHLLQIMAGGSLNVYIRHLWVWLLLATGTIANDNLQLLRLTSAGTGGTAITAVPLDPADAAAGASGMTIPSAKGTEAALVSNKTAVIVQAWPPNGGESQLVAHWDFGDDLSKMLKIAAGVANGVVLKNVSAVATATVTIEAEVIEAPF